MVRHIYNIIASYATPSRQVYSFLWGEWVGSVAGVKKREEFGLEFLSFFSFGVRMKGLEPPRPETLDPKSNAATNYATCAGFLCKVTKISVTMQKIWP